MKVNKRCHTYWTLEPRDHRILSWLTKTGRITPREADIELNLSGGSLTKGISNLRRNGYNIIRFTKTHKGKPYIKYSEYRLVKDSEGFIYE